MQYSTISDLIKGELGLRIEECALLKTNDWRVRKMANLIEYYLRENRPDFFNGEWFRNSCTPVPLEKAKFVLSRKFTLQQRN